jgi:hypothetical protein
VRINCSLCAEQMLDLDLQLSASVNVKSILHTQPLGSYNEILVGIIFVHLNSLPTPILLISPILLMVNTRNCNINAKNNNTANPPPTLEQVLMVQAQMLQTT